MRTGTQAVMPQTSPWRLLSHLSLFVVGAAISLVAAIAGGSAIVGMFTPVQPLVAMALISGLASAGMLLVTAAILRREGSSLSVLGLPTNGHRLRELVAGFVVSAGLFLAVALAQSLFVGAPWRFQGLPGLLAAIGNLPVVGCLVLAEELLFRGAALRLLRAVIGDRGAIVLTATLFGVYHVLGTQYWAMGLFFQVLMPTLGGLLFAWAAVRSNGLALPLGLHLGGNWIQASVAVFDSAQAAAANGAVQSVWAIPVTAADVQMLTAPDVLPRLPMLLAMAAAAALTWVMLSRRRHALPT